MEIINVLNKLVKKKLVNYPAIIFSNLYKKVLNNFYFEFVLSDNYCLFSSSYTQIRGEKDNRLTEFIENHEGFLDSLKKYIVVSLFVYSAIVEENSYYLSSSNNALICRIIHAKGTKFELRFYSHNKDEIISFYHDKIYIGRDFIDLEKFDRESLGLAQSFKSLLFQEQKIQERAKLKLKSLKEYKKPFLNEITYLTKELVKEALDRIDYLNATRISGIKKNRLNDILDNIIYIQNLMIEVKDFLFEFENELRKDKENQFVKYITKFSKDVKDIIRYLRKLSLQFHLKISNFLN